jgi:hypothetical protein
VKSMFACWCTWADPRIPPPPLSAPAHQSGGLPGNIVFPRVRSFGLKRPFGLGEPENGPQKTDPRERGNRHPAVPDGRVRRKTGPGEPGNEHPAVPDGPGKPENGHPAPGNRKTRPGKREPAVLGNRNRVRRKTGPGKPGNRKTGPGKPGAGKREPAVPLLGGATFSSYKYTYKPVMQSYA